MGINFVLNVSKAAADTPHVINGHYLKLPIQDTSSENIIEWFKSAFDFIGKCFSCNIKSPYT